MPQSGGLIPASIARYLRDYQVSGVAFLHKKFVFQGGGIPGDDMGLGKTADKSVSFMNDVKHLQDCLWAIDAPIYTNIYRHISSDKYTMRPACRRTQDL